MNILYHKLHLQAPEATIYVALGLKQIAALSRKLKLEEHILEDFTLDYVDGMFGSDGQYLFILLTEEYNPITTAHECIHAAGRMWEGVGAALTIHNDEVLTYTHDAIHKMIKELYDGNSK